MLNLVLRIVEAESGCVKVDGLDIKTLGLHRLRHSITVIPQDPVLFSGTLRFNLDPLNEAADGGQYWQALQRSHLSDHVARLERENAEDAPCFRLCPLPASIRNITNTTLLGM